MNKLLILFFLLFLSLSLSSQCLQNIDDSKGSVYIESPVSGGILNFDFDNQLKLVNLSGQINYICSDRLVAKDPLPVGYSVTNIAIESVSNPKDIMCYYHLNNVWNYASEILDASVLSSMPSRIEFNTDYTNSNGTDGKPKIQISVGSGGSTLPMIEYSVSNIGSYDPLALDAFAIASGFFQFLHEINISTGTRATNEGVDHGISNYFAGRYIATLKENNEITGYTYGGTAKDDQGNSVPTELWQSINFNLWELYLNYGVLSSYIDENEFKDKDNQPKSELLTATLWQLGKGLGFDKIDQLLSQNYILFNDGYITNQANFGVILYNIVADIVDNPNNNEFSHDDLCYMYKVFGFVYGDAFLGDLTLNKDAYEGIINLDYIIRDSYQGQASWLYGAQAEDVGNESNDETTDFSRSPDIWNRLLSNPSNDKTHQNPEYDGDQKPNYLYVDVRLESCEKPNENDVLHVYIRESHLTAIWPLDWTAGYDDPSDPNSPLIGYEITNASNNDLLAANTLGILMKDHVSLQVERYLDSNTGEDKFYKVYRYEIPWIPLNPADLPEYEEEEAEPWACLLARVVSSEDVMANELSGVTAWDNNVANNNIAIRNTSILTSAGFTGGGGTGGGSVSGLNIKSPYTVSGTPGNIGGGTGTTIGTPTATNAPLALAIGVHPNNDYTDYGDPIIPATTGPGDPVIFNYIDLEIILSDDFLNAWIKSGLKGTGFQRIDENTIKVISPDFSIRNLILPPGKDHRIFVKTTNTQDYTAVDFTLLLKDANDRVIGSQTYNTKGSLWIDHNDPKSGKRNESLNVENLSSIDLHPNPAQDYITVTSNTAAISKIEVYNVSNERIVVSFDRQDTNTTRVDITNLSSGIYFMKVQREENIETIKFVKI